MKKFAHIVLWTIVTLFVACDELPEQPTSEAFLNVTLTSKTLDSAKGSFKITAESNTVWVVNTSAEWLQVVGPTEYEGTCEVMFSYTANTTTKSRGAKIDIAPKVEGTTSSYTILVSQSAPSNSGNGGNTGGDDNTGGNTGGDDDNTGGNTGGNDDNTGDNTGGGNTGGGNNITTDKHTGWAELPAIYDADGNGIDDNDNTLYYTSHFCDGGEKNANKSGKARNYALCFSAKHHVAMWVAAPRHSCYVGSSGRNDSYKVDPTIPASIQFSSKSTGGGCNKGHMLGSAERTSSVATNKQVFYYTNIAPQLSSGFNTGGGGWNKLEDWVDTQCCADTLYEVVGCHFERFTDGYGKTVSPKTISFGGRSDVSMPTMFYYVLLRTKKGDSKKSVFNCSASELQCAAFVRSHTNDHKGQNVTRKEMMSVAELEAITGFKYFVNVPNAPKNVCNPSDWGL